MNRSAVDAVLEDAETEGNIGFKAMHDGGNLHSPEETPHAETSQVQPNENDSISTLRFLDLNKDMRWVVYDHLASAEYYTIVDPPFKLWYKDTRPPVELGRYSSWDSDTTEMKNVRRVKYYLDGDVPPHIQANIRQFYKLCPHRLLLASKEDVPTMTDFLSDLEQCTLSAPRWSNPMIPGTYGWEFTIVVTDICLMNEAK
ncbi:hypothetical protein BU23DRAFT_569237 [Bimuria novae-zelandiae CBS 107.79]|uniref:Uncharacterized protein n=1 Tax=Bimuria novae-zelandiae CBS 107.79 TaxID=1447943 RepID=A0A6A5V537_9PLEO|nr:hypothetical protein BU23DRAFT_569237 [Bimuria novae-zelandiae CBS 107.79]